MARNSGNNIFIPISLERITLEGKSYFFSPAKGVYTALAIIPGIIYVPYVASITQGSMVGLLLGLVTYALVLSVFMRVVVFEEIRWRRLFRDLEENKISNHKYFWGIDRTDKSGIIHYKYTGGHSLRKGVVIKLIRASKIGREESHEFNYRATFRMALNEIFRRGLEVDIYETLDTKSVPYNIQMMIKKAKAIPIMDENDKTREVALEHVRNLAIIAKTSKRVEVTYITLYFNNPRQFKDIMEITKGIQSIFAESKYFKVSNILDKNEVEKFLARTLNVNALPSDEGMVNVPDFSKYGIISRIFNEYGDEEWFEGITASEDSYRKPVKQRKQQDILDDIVYTSDVGGYEDSEDTQEYHNVKIKPQIVDLDSLYNDEIEQEPLKHKETSKSKEISNYQEEIDIDDMGSSREPTIVRPKQHSNKDYILSDSVKEDYKPEVSMGELRRKGTSKVKAEARSKIIEIKDILLRDESDEFFEEMIGEAQEGWNNTSSQGTMNESVDFDYYYGDKVKKTSPVTREDADLDEIEEEIDNLFFGDTERKPLISDQPKKAKIDPDELVDLDSLLG